MKKYLLAVCLTSSSLAWGACERADVEFYLDKGFSPDQITALCGQKGSVEQPNATAPAPNQVVVNDVKVGDVIARLNESLRVKNLVVKDNQLMFIHTPEIEYGRPLIGGDYRTIKPNIDIAIPMKTLRVLTASEGIPMIRSPYIKLGGEVSRRAQGLDGFKKKQRKALDKYLSDQSDKKIRLKFQSGASVDETTSDLKSLIDMYR